MCSVGMIVLSREGIVSSLILGSSPDGFSRFVVGGIINVSFEIFSFEFMCDIWSGGGG